MGAMWSQISSKIAEISEACAAAPTLSALAALSSITNAAETAARYVASLSINATSVATSAYEALKDAASIARDAVVEHVRQLLGSGAAKVAKDNFAGVELAVREHASSFTTTVVAATESACATVVPAAARMPDVLAAVLRKLNFAEVASIVIDIKALVRSIPIVEKFLGLPIPTQVKIAFAAVAVAAGVFFALYGSPASCAMAGTMMKAPAGSGELMILRAVFEANPALYFAILRADGPAAAAASLPNLFM